MTALFRFQVEVTVYLCRDAILLIGDGGKRIRVPYLGRRWGWPSGRSRTCEVSGFYAAVSLVAGESENGVVSLQVK